MVRRKVGRMSDVIRKRYQPTGCGAFDIKTLSSFGHSLVTSTLTKLQAQQVNRNLMLHCCTNDLLEVLSLDTSERQGFFPSGCREAAE